MSSFFDRLLYFDVVGALRRKFKSTHGEKLNVENAPVLLYKGSEDVIFDIHGGGYAFGSHIDEDGYCRFLNEKTGCTVVSCSYPLSNKAKYPEQIETVYRTVRSLSSKGRMFLIGHSAGANCAAAVTLLSQERRDVAVSGIVLNYPVLDLASEPALRPRVEGSTISDKKMRFFNDNYLSTPEQAKEATASPLLALDEQLKRFPPTYILTCSLDVLRSDGIAFFDRLRSLDMDVTYTEANAVHGFIEDGMRKYGSYKNENQTKALHETSNMLLWFKNKCLSKD